MPNRILRDGILSSEAVNSLSESAELFYRRLMSVADDYGRTEAHPTLLRARCYPLRLDLVSEADVEARLSECVSNGLIVVYEHHSKKYLEINNFEQRTRADSKYPAPSRSLRGHHDGHSAVNCQQSAARATTTPTTPTTYPTTNARARILHDRFRDLEAAYPNPTRVDNAARQWIVLVDSGEITEQNIGEVFAGLERWKTSKQWAVKKMQHAMDTWLGFSRNGTPGSRMWLDHPEQADPEELEWR